MAVIDKYRQWFECEVAPAIPAMVKYHMELNGANPDEYDMWLKDSQLLDKGCTDTELHFNLMDEPYISVDMDFDEYWFKLRVADQMSQRIKLETSELLTFIRHWNQIVVDYFGGDGPKLPEMPNFIYE